MSDVAVNSGRMKWAGFALNGLWLREAGPRARFPPKR